MVPTIRHRNSAKQMHALNVVLKAVVVQVPGVVVEGRLLNSVSKHPAAVISLNHPYLSLLWTTEIRGKMTYLSTLMAFNLLRTSLLYLTNNHAIYLAKKKKN